MKKLLFLFFFNPLWLLAQQLPTQRVNQYDLILMNPGYSSSVNFAKINVHHRSQWVGFEDAPNTQTISYTKRIEDRKLGVGAYIFNDRYGPFRRTGFNLSGSYNLKVSEELNIGLGLSTSILQFYVKKDKIDIYHPDDLTADNSVNGSVWTPDFSFGTFAYHKKFYLGFSILHLAANNVAPYHNKTGNSYLNGNLQNARHYFLIGGYNLTINDEFTIIPNAFFEYIKNNPFHAQGGITVRYKQIFDLGFAYSYKDAITALTKINFMKDWALAYSYDFVVSNLGSYNKGSHEIMVGYTINKEKKDKDGDGISDKNDKCPEVFGIKEKKGCPATYLYVMSEDGLVLRTAEMNKDGYFIFTDLPADKQYLFEMEGEDVYLTPELLIHLENNDTLEIIKAVQSKEDVHKYVYLPNEKMELKLFVVDDSGNVLDKASLDSNGIFVFTNLPINNEYLFKMEGEDVYLTDEILVILKNHGEQELIKIFQSKIDKHKYVYLPNEKMEMKLFVVDDSGNVLDKASLDSNGIFVFTNLPINNEYLFKMEGEDVYLTDEILVVLKNHGQQELIKIYQSKIDKHKYNYLPSEKKELTLLIVDDNGKIIHKSIRNKKGMFVFQNLPTDKSYLFKIEGEDEFLKDEIQILIKNNDGNFMMTVKKTDGFYYQYLPNKQYGLAQVEYNDEGALVLLSLEEKEIVRNAFNNLEYKENSDELSSHSLTSLDELSNLMEKHITWNIVLSGHTDDTGTELHNLTLSKKRAEAIKRRLIEDGIDKTRIIVKYYGESQPIADNNTEQGRQKNRRVEMEFVESE